MFFGVPPWFSITWLIVAWAIQTGIDAYFTRSILPIMPDLERVRAWAVSNGLIILVLVLLFRLTLYAQYDWLIAMRDHGSMAIAVLLVIIEYFIWAIPYVLTRGIIVRKWKCAECSAEKRRDFWGTVAVSSIAGVFFIGFLYVAVLIVTPLMEGTDQVFGG